MTPNPTAAPKSRRLPGWLVAAIVLLFCFCALPLTCGDARFKHWVAERMADGPDAGDQNR